VGPAASSEEGTRQTAEGRRQEAVGSRQSAVGSQQVARAKIEKRKAKNDERVSNFDFRVSGPTNPKSKIQNLKSHGIPLKPALTLLPYQRRWIEDDAKLKLVVKARQIGYSFAATLRAVLRCLERQTTWIFLSKGERQSRLLMEKVQEHIRSCGLVAQARESTFFEGTLIKQLETRFPNGSVIYGLPANPDTARGYSGNVTLDEFAFHADADKIYAALYPTITRGYGLEVISTPNGTQGKFYELAKAAGLTEDRNSKIETRKSPTAGRVSDFEFRVSPGVPTWSAHLCDIYDAVRQGLKIDLKLLRAGCEDESAWQQEFCCQFVSTAENFFPPDLLAACLSAEASTDTPLLLLASAPGSFSGLGTRDSGLAKEEGPSPEPRVPSPEFFLGMDIGRHHDRTVFWLDELVPLAATKFETRNSKIADGSANFEFRVSSFESAIGNLAIARLVRVFANTPFREQLSFARELLSLLREDGRPLVRRACIDATGMGAPLAEALTREFGHRVEPVVFTAAVKEDLAFRTKRRMEARLTLLPDTREIRRAFSAVKKIVTPSGNLRFDAERTEAGHADEFWAKALADLAADFQPAASYADAFLADGAPLISPLAFAEVDTRFSIWDF
jgi:phage FluMu gp28-like protein